MKPKKNMIKNMIHESCITTRSFQA